MSETCVIGLVWLPGTLSDRGTRASVLLEESDLTLKLETEHGRFPPTDYLSRPGNTHVSCGDPSLS